MNSLKKYSLNLPENEYHAYPAWSYSMIARYAKDGFSSIADLHEPVISTPSMEFGSLFDSILTRGKATLDEYVVDTTGVSCPPAEKEVFDKIISLGFGEYSYDNLAGMCMGSLKEIMNSCESFCSKYKKEDTKFANLYKNAAYYELHRSGKKVVSQKDWDDAVEMARVFRNDAYLKTIFGTKNTDDIEYIYQAQFLIDYTLDSGKTVKIKIMPDLLIVDHRNMTVQPVDLKTSSVPGWDFKENFLKYRYDIQAKLYSDVLLKVMAKDTDYFDYIMLPYLFVDISRSDKIPVTWVYPQMDESQANGLNITIGDKTYNYKGWQTLLDEILVYEETQAKVPSYIRLDGPNDLMSAFGK